MEETEKFEPITLENRYKNEMMYHARRQTELLEHIAQMLKPQEVESVKQEKRTYQRRKTS